MRWGSLVKLFRASKAAQLQERTKELAAKDSGRASKRELEKKRAMPEKVAMQGGANWGKLQQQVDRSAKLWLFVSKLGKVSK